MRLKVQTSAKKTKSRRRDAQDEQDLKPEFDLKQEKIEMPESPKGERDQSSSKTYLPKTSRKLSSQLEQEKQPEPDPTRLTPSRTRNLAKSKAERKPSPLAAGLEILEPEPGLTPPTMRTKRQQRPTATSGQKLEPELDLELEPLVSGRQTSSKQDLESEPLVSRRRSASKQEVKPKPVTSRETKRDRSAHGKIRGGRASLTPLPEPGQEREHRISRSEIEKEQNQDLPVPEQRPSLRTKVSKRHTQKPASKEELRKPPDVETDLEKAPDFDLQKEGKKKRRSKESGDGSGLSKRVSNSIEKVADWLKMDAEQVETVKSIVSKSSGESITGGKKTDAKRKVKKDTSRQHDPDARVKKAEDGGKKKKGRIAMKKKGKANTRLILN